LETLGSFPETTEFFEIDDLDSCKLLNVGGVRAGKDPFDELNFHVAVWHEDLVELHDRELISGVTPMTEYEWDLQTHERFKDCYYKLPDGTFQKASEKRPNPEDYENDGWYRSFASIDEAGLRVTEAGYRALLEFAPENLFGLHPVIVQRVEPLIAISTDPDNRYFDTVVREATLILEARLKQITGTHDFGQRLVDVYWEMLTREKDFHPALRQELRTLFKFVCNDYAHNLKSISSKQCYALLYRTSRVLSRIERIAPAIQR